MLIDILSKKNSTSNTNTKNIITAISSARGKRRIKQSCPRTDFGPTLASLRCQVITGGPYYRIVHRLKNFKSVEIESAFLPTLI